MSAQSPLPIHMAGAGPTTFTRSITVPPGLPWRQLKAATLEARRATPMAMGALELRLKRLRPWRANRSATFAAVYMRSEELRSAYIARTRVDGVDVEVRFESGGAARTRLTQHVLLLLAASAAILLGGTSILSALQTRGEAESELQTLRAQLDREKATVFREMRAKEQSRALEGLSGRGARLRDVLEEMAAISTLRVPGVPIEAYHWRADGSAVEVRGQANPFPEGEAERAPKQIRPGVWLWIVAREKESQR